MVIFSSNDIATFASKYVCTYITRWFWPIFFLQDNYWSCFRRKMEHFGRAELQMLIKEYLIDLDFTLVDLVVNYTDTTFGWRSTQAWSRRSYLLPWSDPRPLQDVSRSRQRTNVEETSFFSASSNVWRWYQAKRQKLQSLLSGCHEISSHRSKLHCAGWHQRVRNGRPSFSIFERFQSGISAKNHARIDVFTYGDYVAWQEWWTS